MKEPEDGGLARLARALVSLPSAADAERLLREILTPVESRDLALRWRLMEMLAAGVPQRKVSERLGVSLCKITRGARILKSADSVSGALMRKEA